MHAYAFDRATGHVTLLDHSASSTAAPGNGTGVALGMTPDGRYAVFTSTASNLLAGNTPSGGHRDVYRYDRVTGTTVLVTRSGFSAPYGGNGDSDLPSISADGRYVAFASSATNLLPGSSTAGTQVFIWD